MFRLKIINVWKYVEVKNIKYVEICLGWKLHQLQVDQLVCEIFNQCGVVW